MLSLIEALSRQGRISVVAWGGAAVAAVTALAYVAGPQLELPLLYVLPVAVVGWFAGLTAGVLLSFMSAALWLGLDLVHVRDGGGVPYWNTAIRLGALLVFTHFLAAL